MTSVLHFNAYTHKWTTFLSIVLEFEENYYVNGMIYVIYTCSINTYNGNKDRCNSEPNLKIL